MIKNKVKGYLNGVLFQVNLADGSKYVGEWSDGK